MYYSKIFSANGFYIWYPQIFNKLSNQAGDLPISGKTICEIYNTPMTVNIQSILPVIVSLKLIIRFKT